MRGCTAWLHSPGPVTLGDRDIHVWRASLDRWATAIEELRPTLSTDEKERAVRFIFERDQTSFTTARGILRKLLGAYTGSPPGALRFRYGALGKPALADESEIHFNLAHSHGLALYAFARNCELGVDLERVRPDFAGQKIAKRYFSTREVAALRALPTASKIEGFFNCWARKEAYIKARGNGLQIALDSFDVALDPGTEARFLGGVDAGWNLVGLSAADLYPAALVYRGECREIRYFDLMESAHV